jgi:hypothetical protein
LDVFNVRGLGPRGSSGVARIGRCQDQLVGELFGKLDYFHTIQSVGDLPETAHGPLRQCSTLELSLDWAKSCRSKLDVIR